jgi:aminomethyltransferase
VEKIKKQRRQAQGAGKALHSCLLNDKGGVIDDLIAYFFREDHFRLVVKCPARRRKTSRGSANSTRRRARDSHHAAHGSRIIAAQGRRRGEHYWAAYSGARAPTESLKPFNAAHIGATMVARTGYTGEDGFEFVKPANEAQSCLEGARPQRAALRLVARDTLRLEAGMNLYGQDRREGLALDAGLA